MDQQPPPSQPIGFNPSDNGNDKPKPVVDIKAPRSIGNYEELGYIPDIKQKLQELDNILKDLRTTTNGAVLMVMPLPTNLVCNCNCKGKEPLQCPVVRAQQDVKNYDVVLTWLSDSNLDQQRQQCKSALHELLSGTNWKISEINPPEAVVQNVVKEDSQVKAKTAKEEEGGEQSGTKDA